MPAPKRSPPRPTADAPPESTHDRVRRCAVELFAKQGFNGTGVRDIADAAGLKTATLYYHMTTKDDLLLEIMVGAIGPLNAAAAEIEASTPDPAARLARIVEQHVWVHATDRLRTLVTDTELRALSGAPLQTVMALRDTYEGYWRAAVRDGVATGVFCADHVDLVARALLQMATGVTHWFSADGNLRLEDICCEYSDWALALLRAQREGAPVRRAQLQLPSPSAYL